MTVARNNRALRRVAASFFLLSGLAQTALAEDPGAPGPLPVSVAEYDFGDTAFSPTGFPGMVEVRANVHHPTDLTAGPFPLVIFLHGRHDTCFEGTSVFLQWPCSGSREPIPSFEGYDYLGQVLASHGYVVVSISANGINADDNFSADFGMLARAELIQEHLKHWETFNTVGGAPFGNTFVGAVDLANVGTMGHSRGGEGVVRHFLLNDSLGSPFQIRAVFPLASVDFDRPVINDVPLSVLLPYCDGDVSDLQGVHFYDDARYNVPGDTGRKHTLLVMGANHNFYNTVWTPGLFPAGGVDDWIYTFGDTDSHCGTVPGNGRLSAAAQRGTSLAYVSAFFRTYLGGEVQFLPILTGNAPPPASAMNAEVFASFHSPDDPLLRMDVNRLLDDPNLTTNTLGGAVSQGGLMPYKLCGGDLRQLLRCPPFSRIQWSQQPHTAPSLLAFRTPGLSQLTIGWNTSSATYENALPPSSRDVTGFGAFQFRGSVNFHDGRNPAGLPQDLTVVLTDGDGNAEGARVSDYSGALFAPPGETIAIPKVVLNTVQIPLSAFPGIDLADVRTVRFDFDEEPMGALLVTDLAFTSLFPPPVCDANGPYLAECTAPDAPVMLDGTGSTTASANPLSFTWTGPFQGGVAMGPEPIVKFGGLGNFTVDLEVDDGFGWAQCSADVTIEDTTPPVIACSFATPSLPAREHRLVDVGLTAEALDACEGTLPVALRVFSDEDDAEGKGSGRHSPDAKLDPELRLRAERAGRGDGTVYLVVAHATDSSSNASHACCTLGVPHDQSAGARASVDAQAAAAQTYCESFAAPPAGFFAVGDGPEIGPKQ